MLMFLTCQERHGTEDGPLDPADRPREEGGIRTAVREPGRHAVAGGAAPDPRLPGRARRALRAVGGRGRRTRPRPQGAGPPPARRRVEGSLEWRPPLRLPAPSTGCPSTGRWWWWSAGWLP